jgi:hypothetical protein
MTLPEDPFRAYHRARWRMSLARVTAGIGVSAALAVGLGLLVGAAPPAVVSAPVESAGIPSAVPTPVATPVAEVALPEPQAAPEGTPSEPPAPAELPATGPASWSIAIDTRGYQAEIDQCLWVRMDLGGQAPIVGAHNYCGGGDVLEMSLGDSVTLAGTGLDGVYLVTDARDARAGDTAATAIAGMVGRVILQTCYWADDGTVRLVGLTPAPVG